MKKAASSRTNVISALTARRQLGQIMRRAASKNERLVVDSGAILLEHVAYWSQELCASLMSPAARQIVWNLTGVLVQAAHPKRIILFGSQARGDAAPHSDFDIMVVEEKPADRFGEMVRLNRLIRSFDIAVDLLVVSDEKFQYWRETPGNVYYEAATGGQVLYQAA